ncbi:LuxR C-terminal-related transcriptional regulator [Candidatus Methylomirabilis sp.]|jgi:PAS domain S-box-containing protein|uniref:response regulator transcription factor n=1 Tax=Candidatus Methylomirabilis sp. TaxID=2032687 RepID=UPI003C70DBAF
MQSLLNILSNIADGALAVNREHKIVFWNKAAEKLLGFKTEEVLGRFCYEVIAGLAEPGRPFCRIDCLDKMLCIERGEIPTDNMLVTTKAGQEVWLSVSTILVPSEYRSHCTLIHLLRNSTYLKELERSVQRFLTTMSKLSTGNESGINEDLSANLQRLTRREQEILCLLGSGSTTQTIAETLFISSATVRNHIHRILAKLRVKNRLEAALLARSAGLI